MPARYYPPNGNCEHGLRCPQQWVARHAPPASSKRKCPQCGRRAKMTVDHIVPKVRGGLNCGDNFRLVCQQCNSSKHAVPPAEYAQRTGITMQPGLCQRVVDNTPDPVEFPPLPTPLAEPLPEPKYGWWSPYPRNRCDWLHEHDPENPVVSVTDLSSKARQSLNSYERKGTIIGMYLSGWSLLEIARYWDMSKQRISQITEGARRVRRRFDRAGVTRAAPPGRPITPRPRKQRE